MKTVSFNATICMPPIRIPLKEHLFAMAKLVNIAVLSQVSLQQNGFSNWSSVAEDLGCSAFGCSWVSIRKLLFESLYLKLSRRVFSLKIFSRNFPKDKAHMKYSPRIIQFLRLSIIPCKVQPSSNARELADANLPRLLRDFRQGI